MQFKSRMLAGCAAAMTLSTGNACYAQAAEDSSVAGTSDIVVMARKRAENAQDVPISITAFSGAELTRLGAREFKDFALSNPNVNIEGVQGLIGSLAFQVGIRGNVQTQSLIIADPAVGTYMDGHLISRTYGTIGLSTDIESVQTLKGPQGTLFGRNTTGGAVLIKTRDPELGEVNGYAQAEIGEIATRNFGAGINLPLGDKVAIRIVYQNDHQGNFASYTNGVELGRRRGQMLRGKLRFDPTETTRIYATVEVGEQKAHPANTVAPPLRNPQYKDIPVTVVGTGPGLSPIDPRARQERTYYQGEFYALRIEQEVGDGAIKLLAGHRDYDIEATSTLPPRFGYTVQDKPGNSDSSVELQYTGKLFDGLMDVAGGLFYFEDTLNEASDVFLYSGLQRNWSYLTQKGKSKSAYAQANLHLGPRFNITAGLRYTDDKKKAEMLEATLGSPGLGTEAAARALPAASFDFSDNRVNYLISTDFKPVDHVMLYASHATGYRAGGSSNVRSSYVPTNPGFSLISGFLPEDVKNYEVGFKTELPGGLLRINGAAFLQDYKDYQYSAIDPQTISRISLNADARIKGFELDGSLNLPTGTRLTAALGHVNARIDDTSSPSDGARFSFVSPWTWSAALSQRFDVADGRLDLSATYSWRSKFHTAVDDPLAAGDEVARTQVQSVGLLNLSASYAKGPVTVSVRATNLTNKHYFNYLTDAGGGFIYNGSLGTPRVVSGSIRFDF